MSNSNVEALEHQFDLPAQAIPLQHVRGGKGWLGKGREGAGAVLAFRAALSRAASTQVTFDYATSDGTADVVSDCTPPNAVLTIRAGSSSETIEAPVLDGSHNEGNETPTRSQG